MLHKNALNGTFGMLCCCWHIVVSSTQHFNALSSRVTTSKDLLSHLLHSTCLRVLHNCFMNCPDRSNAYLHAYFICLCYFIVFGNVVAHMIFNQLLCRVYYVTLCYGYFVSACYPAVYRVLGKALNQGGILIHNVVAQVSPFF